MTAEVQDMGLRMRLLESGRDVFADIGYAGATVNHIVERASASRATFYRYFRSKDDLFWELCGSCFREVNAVLRELGAVDSGPAGRMELEQLLRAYGRLYTRHRGIIRAWFERHSGPGTPLVDEATQAFSGFVETLTISIKARASPSVVDPEVQAALFFIAINRSYEYVMSRYSLLDLDRLAPTLATMMQRAFFGAGGASASSLSSVGQR